MESIIRRRNSPEMIVVWTQRITDYKNSGKYSSGCAEIGINASHYAKNTK